jgi:hypothetical protein
MFIYPKSLLTAIAARRSDCLLGQVLQKSSEEKGVLFLYFLTTRS